MVDDRARAKERSEYVVLVIDPDPLNRDVTVTVLRHFGFQVVEAEEPEAGLRLARECDPCVIVTELFERTRTGWEILERLAGEEGTTAIPVVAFTAHVLPPDRKAAVHGGVARYLPKPLPPRELEAAIEELLGLVQR